VCERHPKWIEASLSADIPGWQRFKAAEDWLVQPNVRTSSQLLEKTEFDRFVTERQLDPNDQAQRSLLFRQFIDWQKQRSTSGQTTPK
jgi:hypothetical protein